MKAKIDARKRIENARKSFQSGDYARALQDIDEVIRLDESNTEALTLREQIAAARQVDALRIAQDAVQRAAAEPDLDRRVEILRTAAGQCSGDHFLQTFLILNESRRDVVGAIWARARYFDRKRQFDEALEQLRTIEAIYPECPGLSRQLALVQQHKDHPELVPEEPVRPPAPVVLPPVPPAEATPVIQQHAVPAAPPPPVASAVQPPPAAAAPPIPPVAQPQFAKPAPPKPAPAVPAAPNRNLMWIGLAAALLVIVGGLGYFLTRGKTPPAEPPKEEAVAPVAPAKVEPVAAATGPQVRIDASLPGGEYVLDSEPAKPLDSALTSLDLAPGTHTITVNSKYGPSSIEVVIAGGAAPQATLKSTGKGMAAFALSSYDTSGQLTSTLANLPVKADSGVLGRTGAAIAIEGTPGTPQNLVVGEGDQQWPLVAAFDKRPGLTWYLRVLNVPTGGVRIKVDQDDVLVRIDGRTMPGKLKSGELRPFAGLSLGTHEIRVEKPGYRVDPPFKRVTVAKGPEVAAEFKLFAQSSLEIQGSKPGNARIFVNGADLGAIDGDGNGRASGFDAGPCKIELKREKYTHKPLEKTCKAGEPLVLRGDEVKMTGTFGYVEWEKVVPATTKITAQREGEREPHPISNARSELPVGKYTFRATAPGYKPKTSASDINIIPERVTSMPDWTLEAEK